jgi:hypothetical protein
VRNVGDPEFFEGWEVGFHGLGEQGRVEVDYWAEAVVTPETVGCPAFDVGVDHAVGLAGKKYVWSRPEFIGSMCKILF